MRDYEFRQKQENRKKAWAAGVVARWINPSSPEGRRAVGKVAASHTAHGYFSRYKKLLKITKERDLHSHDNDLDEASGF